MTQIALQRSHSGFAQVFRRFFAPIALPAGAPEARAPRSDRRTFAEARRDRAAARRLHNIAEAARWNLPGY